MKNPRFYFLLSTFCFLPALVFAQADSPGEFVNRFYNWALALSGVLAFGAIVWGGVVYTFARGNPAGQSEGKKWITGALLGLALLGGAYLILYTINPEIVSLRVAELEKPASFPAGGGRIGGGGGAGGGAATSTTGGSCPIPPLTSMSGFALGMEGGNNVLFGSCDVNINRNLTKLKQEFDKLKAAVAENGIVAQANSAYRPLAYQKHLWEIVDRWVTKGLRENTEQACAQLKNTVREEYSRHGLGTVVASPSSCAPHVRGVGIDISLPSNYYASINSLLSEKRIDLRWSAIPNDEVHFNLQNPPFSGCSSALPSC